MNHRLKTGMLLAEVLLLSGLLLATVTLTACGGTATPNPAPSAETSAPTETPTPEENSDTGSEPSPETAFYHQLVLDLRESDYALCDGIELVYFSVSPGKGGRYSALPELDGESMDALLTLLAEDFSAEAYEGTYQDVKELGLLEDDGMFFPNGVIFTLTDNGNGTFDAEMWRSGLGAIFWMDCVTVEEETGWSYQVGGFAIS